MSTSETALSDTMQVVTFTIANKSGKTGNYAVPIEQVKEIKIVDAITKIPKSKSYVKGIMNLRGKIIPIVDVNNKIGAPKSNNVDDSKQRILVADVNDSLTGLLVDEVNEVMRFSTKELEPAPEGAFENNSYIKGIVNVKDNLIVLLDVSKFLEDSTDGIKEAMSSTTSESSTEQASESSTEQATESPTEQATESPTEQATESASTETDEKLLPEIEAIINQEKQN